MDILSKTTNSEVVVSLSKKYSRQKDYVQIGIDVEDYYRIKDSEKVENG